MSSCTKAPGSAVCGADCPCPRSEPVSGMVWGIPGFSQQDEKPPKHSTESASWSTHFCPHNQALLSLSYGFSHMCPDTWIGFQSKCYYFSENRNDWNTSLENCKALEASLTSIDSLEELGFLLRYGRALHYWVGLHQEGSDPWRWCNGPLTSPSATLCRFDIQGNGQCAYIDLAGVSSDWCSQQKYLVCSHTLKSPRGA
uniref:C-type lectin domain-containing protein n=1 Tax=Anas platyrhynchos TaxID=8839 RepID=A0A8B9T377_ANAPL